MERANISDINQLVTTCEEIFEREREAWLSTSMTTKLLASEGSASLAAAADSKEFDNPLTPTQSE
jgi:hypothetical protein